MNASLAAAPSFTSHLLASDKREWSLTVSGLRFVLVRTEPEAGDDEASSDCAWCGGEVDTPRPIRSTRGEIFCSRAHRDASARAVRRLHERDTACVRPPNTLP